MDGLTGVFLLDGSGLFKVCVCSFVCVWVHACVPIEVYGACGCILYVGVSSWHLLSSFIYWKLHSDCCQCQMKRSSDFR